MLKRTLTALTATLISLAIVHPPVQAGWVTDVINDIGDTSIGREVRKGRDIIRNAPQDIVNGAEKVDDFVSDQAGYYKTIKVRNNTRTGISLTIRYYDNASNSWKNSYYDHIPLTVHGEGTYTLDVRFTNDIFYFWVEGHDYHIPKTEVNMRGNDTHIMNFTR